MTLRAVERAQLALVVVDATDGFTDGDLRIIALVRERGCAAVIVLNKWDLLARDEDRRDQVERSLDRKLRALAHHPVVQVSAKTGKGVAKLFPLIAHLGEAAGRRIPTAELNRWLADCVGRHEPAMATKGARRRPLKFFYATQTGSYPPRFALFCTDPKAIQPSYRRFLENRLREDFQLEGVPLRLSLRPRRASDDAPE
jgi:GTP-binding protein